MLTDTMIALEEAHRTGDRARIGWAHLDVVAALNRAMTEAPDPENARAERRKMLDHAEAALRAFADLDPALQVDAHLVKAAVLSDVAHAIEERVERLRWVDRALDHCQQAFTLLSQAEDVPYALAGDACATAITVTLRLRRGLADTEPVVEALEGMTAAYSELWGTFLAWDLRAREKGHALLLQAQLLEALQEEDAPEAALVAAGDQLALARDAWEQLRRTGDRAGAQEARALIDAAQQRVRALEDASVRQKADEALCPQCGSENEPGVRFCTQCGAGLDAGQSREGRWVCSTCRRSNRSGVRFCTQCGTPRR